MHRGCFSGFREAIDLHDPCSRRRTHWQFTPYQRSIEQLPEGLWHGDDSELDGEAIPARLTSTQGMRLRRPKGTAICDYAARGIGAFV